MEDRFGTLEKFKDFWMKNQPIRPPFKNSIFVTDIAYSICLYRSQQYQVELYLVKPNIVSPEHRHPDVDSITVYLTGNLTTGMKDKPYTDVSKYQKENPKNGLHRLYGYCIENNPGQNHSLKSGPEGGAFLVFEKWLKGNPTSVTIRWEGDTVGQDHDNIIKNHNEKESNHVANS